MRSHLDCDEPLAVKFGPHFLIYPKKAMRVAATPAVDNDAFVFAGAAGVAIAVSATECAALAF